MADYIFEVPLTGEGNDIVTDPAIVDNIIVKGTDMIPRVTYGNLNVESFSVDAETKRIYYGITASSEMKLGLTLGDLAWYDTLIAGVAIAGAVVCAVAGAPIIVPVGLAIVAGIALARESISGFIEVEATKVRTKEKIADAVIEGTITPEEGNELADSVDEHWGEGIPWTTIIVGGMVGVLALGALYIFMKTK